MRPTRTHAAAFPRSRDDAARHAGPEAGAVLARLRHAARECVGDDVCELSAGGPRFLWIYGSTMLEAVPDLDGSVLLRAFLVLGPVDDGHLQERLAAYEGRVPFGRLVLDDDGDIALEHRVPPDADRARLEGAIREMSRQADRLDDLLWARFGGVRSLDRLRRDVLLALGPDN